MKTHALRLSRTKNLHFAIAPFPRFSAEESPIAILNHNRPESYLLSAAFYEKLLARLEDLEDSQLIIERANGPFIELGIDDL